MVLRSCRLGVGYFVGEIAGGVTGFVFNTILLGLSGNVAVAAYGIVCNVAVIGTAVFPVWPKACSRWPARHRVLVMWIAAEQSAVMPSKWLYGLQSA